MTKINIGYNPAANMLPIFHFLDRSNPRLQFVRDVPAGHNRLLDLREIDMAPISAFSYGQHWQKYTILTDLSVSANGSIGSILLYSKFPLTALDGKTIALTNTSATSVNLLKVILAKFYRVRPNYITMAPDLEPMLEAADAALLIADEALMGLAKNTSCQVFDLGSEWYKHTSLPMVFSVWAVADEVIQTCSDEVAYVHDLLLASKQQGLLHTETIINYCMQTLGEDHRFWSQYFSQVHNGLELEYLHGLTTYFRFCTELGLLDVQPEIKLWP
ncbi:MAG: menaquinone biosynthesis protein [Peptococcaceae bacterium]|nr:menaquinone biosynthesis protein [Peptococcaceae bacterium]